MPVEDQFDLIIDCARVLHGWQSAAALDPPERMVLKLAAGWLDDLEAHRQAEIQYEPRIVGGVKVPAVLEAHRAATLRKAKALGVKPEQG